MKLFREADLHEEKVRLMRCMGAVSQPELIKKVLDFSVSVSFTRFNCICFNFLNYFFVLKFVFEYCQG